MKVKNLFCYVCFIFLIAFVFISSFFSVNVFAENLEYKTILDSCVIVKEPNSSLGVENNLLVLSYNSNINLESEEEVADKAVNSNLKYYKVKYNEVSGYILTGAVSKKEVGLEKKLQTNAVLTCETEVYSIHNKEEKLKINNEEIKLGEKTEVKLLEEYNSKNEYTLVSFYLNGEIVSGYVLTKNISVGGFNYIVVIVIFVLIIVFSTAIPIIIKNWKKRKNQPIDKISTSPHKTSK